MHLVATGADQLKPQHAVDYCGDVLGAAAPVGLHGFQGQGVGHARIGHMHHSTDDDRYENRDLEDRTDVRNPLADIQGDYIDRHRHPGQRHADGNLAGHAEFREKHLLEYPGEQDIDRWNPHRRIHPVTPGGPGRPAAAEAVPDPGINATLLRVSATHLCTDHCEGDEEQYAENDPPGYTGSPDGRRSCKGVRQQDG